MSDKPRSDAIITLEDIEVAVGHLGTPIFHYRSISKGTILYGNIVRTEWGQVYNFCLGGGNYICVGPPDKWSPSSPVVRRWRAISPLEHLAAVAEDEDER